MVSECVTLTNSQGLHMRPATQFVKEMNNFDAVVSLHAGGRETNGKSVMALMAACLRGGTEVEVRCSGRQEAAALQRAVELIKSGFGETDS